jgi:putative membrane protein insertion efficiency factor
MLKSVILLLIKFYQKFLTLFSYGSCRYYPTCSSYAKIQFEKNNIVLAFWYSGIRILSCNPLFAGGIDYPKISFKPNNIVFTKIKVKYWFVSDGHGKYFVIKNWERNKQ